MQVGCQAENAGEEMGAALSHAAKEIHWLSLHARVFRVREGKKEGCERVCATSGLRPFTCATAAYLTYTRASFSFQLELVKQAFTLSCLFSSARMSPPAAVSAGDAATLAS